MHGALVEAGLFGDEARALLDTWRHSYFDSPGLRLFFLVPQEWTDRILPLEISVQTETTRVMVGRIELVTPELRRRLRKLSEAEGSTPQWLYDLVVESGSGDMATLVEAMPERVPRDYALYRSLGRFANALVLDELARRPSSRLQSFVDTYRLRGHSSSH